MAIAGRALRRKDLATAEAVYQDLTERYPRHPKAWNSLAFVFSCQDRWDEANGAFAQAAEHYPAYLELHPREVGAWSAYIQALWHLLRADEGDETLRRAVEINPGAQQLKNLKQGTAGIVFRMERDECRVRMVYPEFGGGKAGLRPEDTITHIDGETVTGLSEQAIHGRLRGEIGTEHRLTVKRPGESEPITITVRSASVRLWSAKMRQR